MKQKISVIIPAYNIEAYLGKTLESVLSQTYQSLEIIVVNDGSKDETGQIAEHYAKLDQRIRVIHKENGGVTSARLRGIREATGQWIGFVDGDDLLDADMYQRLMDNAMKYGADISHCGYQMVFPDGHIDYYHNTGVLREQNHIMGLTDLLSGETVEPALWNKLFRKELFASVQNNAEMLKGITINEDVLMNYYLFRAAKSSVFEDVSFYHYVLRRGSAATAGLNPHKLLDPLRVTKIIFQDAQNMPELYPAVLVRLARQLVALATMPCKKQKDLTIPARNSARRELRSLLPAVLKCGDCSRKQKFMTLWAAYLPETYGWVHSIYLKVTGLDKIYNLD